MLILLYMQRLDPGGGSKGKGKAIDASDEFAPDPYDEDEHKVRQDDNAADNYSPAVREMMKK